MKYPRIDMAKLTSLSLRYVFLVAMVFSLAGIPLASAQDASPESIDAALDRLLALTPEQVAETIQSLKGQLEAKEKESRELKERASQLEAAAAALDAKLKTILSTIDGLAKGLGMVPPPPQAMAPPPDDSKAAAMAVKASLQKAKLNFRDDVQPILESRCMRCHNEDKQRGGLSMATFATLMDGGSSGAVLAPGQPDGSRMLRLARRMEEPIMPPSGDPLSEEQLTLIRLWIEKGAAATAGSKGVKVAKLEVSKGPVFVAAVMADGPPPMPEVSLPSPKTHPGVGVVARAVATSPTAPLLAIGGDNEIILYDVEELKLLGVIPFPEGDIFTLTFSLNGELLLAGGGEEGDSGIAVLWNVRTAERLGEFGKAYDTVLAAAISPDHRLVAVGGPSKKVRVYSAEDGSLLYKLDAHSDWIYAIKFTPDGEVLSTADRAGNLFMWQAENGRPAETLRGHVGPIHDMDYTHDSVYLATAGEDGQVILWDTWKFKQVRKFRAHAGGVLSLHISKEGHIITSGKDGLTKRWDLNGTLQSTYEKLPDWSYQARFASQGRLVLAGSWDGHIAVWKMDSGERLATFATNPAS